MFQRIAKKICKDKFTGGRLVEIYNNQQQQFLIKILAKIEKEYTCIDPGYYYDEPSENTDDGTYDYIYWASSTSYLCNMVSWWIGLERVKGSEQKVTSKIISKNFNISR